MCVRLSKSLFLGIIACIISYIISNSQNLDSIFHYQDEDFQYLIVIFILMLNPNWSDCFNVFMDSL